MSTTSTPKKMPLTLASVGDILGLQEVAVLLEVGARTPHAWLYRGLLPVPDYASINGIRAWKRKTIIRWAAETGRLPVSGALGAESSALNVESPAHRGGRQAAAKAKSNLEKAAA